MGYWPEHIIEGERLDLSHVEPFQLNCYVKNLDRTLCLDVVFSNHCFTEAFKEGEHAPALKIMDGSSPRAFDRRRYALSAHLPGLVRSLPGAAVWQTPTERNYMYFMALIDGSGRDYQMFFHLKKEKGSADLRLRVESAYSVERAGALIKSSTKVRFPVLCQKVFQNQLLRFHTKR